MSIIYVISVIALYVSFLLVKKSEKVLDLTISGVVCIVILLCYNTFVCFLFTTIHIPINLLTLTILNFSLSSIFIVFITRGKKQKYIFDKRDVIVILIIFLVAIIVSVVNFGLPFKIQYVTTDSGVHYYESVNFSKNDKLVGNVMPGAYSNAGILMKTASPYMEYVELYKVFICFDIFMFFMTGVLMYVALKHIIKNKFDIIISAIIAIVYMIGYPMNVLLFGHFYLQLGIIVFSTIVILMEYFEEINKKYFIVMLFLLCFELFFSYFLFVPAVYGVLGIYFIYYFRKKNNKLINKEAILYIVITLVLPFIMGFVYHILPDIFKATSISNVRTVIIMAQEGYIYRNMYSNLLLFIPFVLIYISKKKEVSHELILLCMLLLYIIVLMVACIFKVLSTYYMYKIYFILWFLIVLLFAKSMINIGEQEKNGKTLVGVYIGVYIVLLIGLVSTQKFVISKELNTGENLLDVMDIYGSNLAVLKEEANILTPEEIEVFKHFYEEVEITKDTEILILADPKTEYWFWGMFGYKNREEPQIPINPEEVVKWNENTKYDYLIYFNDGIMRYEQYGGLVDLNKDVIFSNNSGGLLKNE